MLSVLLFSCAGEKKADETPFGIQLWSVRGDMNEDPSGTLKALGEMGYAFVEAAGYRDGKFYGMDPVEFKDLVEANGMKFRGSHTGQDIPEDVDMDQVMAWWNDAFEAHKAAGVEYVVMPWMGRTGHESLAGLKRYCDYFNAVGELANSHGVRFGFHNHAEEFKELEGEIIYDFMLNNTDPEKVMFQMDLYWVVVGGKDPADYFQRFPGRFESWHVKDEEEVGASGNINFERIWGYAELSGVETFVVEVEKYNFEPLESVRVSLEFLKNADFVR